MRVRQARQKISRYKHVALILIYIQANKEMSEKAFLLSFFIGFPRLLESISVEETMRNTQEIV